MKVWVLACGILTATVAAADQWSPPPLKWPSSDGKFALAREDNLRSISLTLVDLRAAKPRTIWKVQSPLGALPQDVAFSSDGNFVVLINRYGSLGRGKVLSIIGPKGKARATHELKDFLPGSEIANAPHSISSIWWNPGAPAYIRNAAKQLVVFSAAGTLRAFDLASGRKIELSRADDAVIREEAAQQYRPKLLLKDTENEAAYALAAVRDRQSLPKLLELMDSAKHPEGFADAYRRILGDDSAPELEKRASDPTRRRHLITWLRLMPDGPKGKAALRRLVLQDPRLSEYLSPVADVLTAGDVRRNIEWLTSPQPYLRSNAVRALLFDPVPLDIPHIERLLKSEDSSEQYHALHALVKIQPPDLRSRLAVLRGDANLLGEVTLELARLGDAQAIEEIRRDLTTRRQGSRLLTLFLFEDTCRLIAERRYSWGTTALKGYRKRSDERYIAATGALAALGDRSALSQIRAAVSEGQYLDRISAMEWLVILKDRAGKNYLVQATHDEDPEVAKAARESLDKLSRDLLKR